VKRAGCDGVWPIVGAVLSLISLTIVGAVVYVFVMAAVLLLGAALS
jgi:hypothetical protein